MQKVITQSERYCVDTDTGTDTGTTMRNTIVDCSNESTCEYSILPWQLMYPGYYFNAVMR